MEEEIAVAFSPVWHRADRGTRLAGAGFDIMARAPRWQAFLERIVPSPAMRDYLQMVFGYCLSGSTSEQCVFLFQGEGGNGKSVLLSVIAHILGDYAMPAPIETFLRDKNRSGSGPSPDLARLPGARLVKASEPRKGDVLDEGRIKEFSGGEEMSARKLREDIFDFRPQGKLFLSFNRTPSIYSDDDGTWRRIHVVPFSVQIPRPERRPFETVVQELTDEADGVLLWMIEGWRRYAAAGKLDRPEEVREASEELRESLDTVGQFLTDCCVKGNDEEVAFKPLYLLYEKWADRLGDKPISRKALGMALGNKGYRNSRGGGNKSAMRRGLRLRYMDEAPPDVGKTLFAEWLTFADSPLYPPGAPGGGAPF